MKVKDLILKLQRLDQNALILVDGYEDGYNAPKGLLRIQAIKNNPKNSSNYKYYCGEYHKAEISEGKDEKKVKSAIVLSRY